MALSNVTLFDLLNFEEKLDEDANLLKNCEKVSHLNILWTWINVCRTWQHPGQKSTLANFHFYMDLTSNEKCKIQITDVFYQLQKNCQIALSPGHGTIANSDAVSNHLQLMLVRGKLPKCLSHTSCQRHKKKLHILSCIQAVKDRKSFWSRTRQVPCGQWDGGHGHG